MIFIYGNMLIKAFSSESAPAISKEAPGEQIAIIALIINMGLNILQNLLFLLLKRTNSKFQTLK